MNNSKNYMKKIALMLIIASLSVTCFGCSDKKNDSSEDTPRETISLDQTKQPLTFVHDVESEADATEAKEDAEEDETTTAVSGADATNNDTGNAKSSTAVTPNKTVPVTEHVDVTDASGQPVTDSNGNKQTEVVNVTEKVDVTDASGQPVTDNNGNKQTEVVEVTEAPATNNNTATEAVAYTPSYDVCKAYWLDMSQECDFFFNGEFLVIEFEVNQDIPDGNYPITFKKTDIASWDVVKWDPVCINGEVAVNSDITPQEEASGSDFTLKVNSVAAKQGDTAIVTVDLSNNPGFCGFVIEVEYDKSALKIVSTDSGADFDNAVNYIAQ